MAVRRRCGTCRYFQRSPTRNLGWCLNPKLPEIHRRVVVQQSEFACDRKYFDLWAPAGPGAELQRLWLSFTGSVRRRLDSPRQMIVAGTATGLAALILLCFAGIVANATATRPVITAARPTAYSGPAPRPTPQPAATAAPTKFKIGNTDGLGAYIRNEPSVRAAGIKPWEDGTVLTIVGQDRVVDGKPWKNVRDPAGNIGWILAEYLLPAE